MNAQQKRLDQKKELWIKNIMKINGINRIEAEKLYLKILPYRND